MQSSNNNGRRPRLAVVVGLGWGVRNFLINETFERLKSEYDLLLLTTYSEVEGFRERFQDERVQVLPLEPVRQGWLTKQVLALTRICYWARYNTVSHQYKLGNMRERLRAKARKKKPAATVARPSPAAEPTGPRPEGLKRHPLIRAFKFVRRGVRRTLKIPRRWLVQLLRMPRRWKSRVYLVGLPWMRHIGPPLFPLLLPLCRRLLARAESVRALRQLMRQEQVCGVFSTNCCSPNEWAPTLAAHGLGLPIVAAITSWDNPSSKGMLICEYDGLLTWTPRMAEDVRRFMNDSGRERIHVTGPPQFDYYARPEYQRERGVFCQAHGLDPERQIVVYSTVTPGIMPEEPEVVRRVHEILRQKNDQVQLLVRLHPKDPLERYDALRAEPCRANIVWTLAGEPLLQRSDQWCPGPEDMIRAVGTVRHADVNVHCSYSTMMLDFSAHDTPVVVVAHDIDGSSERFRCYERYEHIKPVLEFDAIAVAYSHEQLEQQLLESLARPEARAPQRQALVEAILGKLDGRAGLRSAEAVIQEISRARLARR